MRCYFYTCQIMSTLHIETIFLRNSFFKIILFFQSYVISLYHLSIVSFHIQVLVQRHGFLYNKPFSPLFLFFNSDATSSFCVVGILIIEHRNCGMVSLLAIIKKLYKEIMFPMNSFFKIEFYLITCFLSPIIYLTRRFLFCCDTVSYIRKHFLLSLL